MITEYMRRIKVAGYPEKYRKEVLEHVLGIYDKKWKDHRDDTQPIFRPKSWTKGERKKAKASKTVNWATKGGHIAQFVPTTPGGTLLKIMRKVADTEAKEGLKFKMMEVGGKTVKRALQKGHLVLLFRAL